MQRSYRSNFLKSRLKIILLVLLATTTIALTVIARPVAHLTLTAWSDRDDRQPLPPGTVDDASHLNQTQVTIKQVKSQPGVTEVILQSVLRDALRQGKKVAIAGSRHTMGGQTLYNGISLDMLHFNRMQFNPATKILTVQSGAKWSEIIPYLYERGYSVAVMQSNNDFSVGGTMSANAPLRNVRQDNDSFLRYADREVFGLVMLFHQQRTPEAEAKMQVMTQKLIDAPLAVGGRYYLPYRLHATPEQFHRAYPQAAKFFALKRKYDPNGIFQNYFYLKYGS